MPLIVPGEVHGRAATQSKFRYAPDLGTIVNPPRIFPKTCFLSVAQQIWSRNVMMIGDEYPLLAQSGHWRRELSGAAV